MYSASSFRFCKTKQHSRMLANDLTYLAGVSLMPAFRWVHCTLSAVVHVKQQRTYAAVRDQSTPAKGCELGGTLLRVVSYRTQQV